MKKSNINLFIIIFTVIIVGCKSIPQEELNSSEFIKKYYSTSEKDCNFIFEFINQSNKTLRITSFIAETKNMENQYYPTTASSIIVVEPGECFDLKINADKLIKDFKNNYCVGINCYEKNWHWWYSIEKGMKYKRVRIIARNDLEEGGIMLYPPFKGNDKFEIKELSVEYQNRNYKSYQLIETPEQYKNFYDGRVFYTNNSNNSSRISNIFVCSCQELIEDCLEKGYFSIVNTEGFVVLALNNDPLDLNNYVVNDDANYDFIYEIVNNADEKIAISNLLLDEEQKVLSLTNDVELEPGQSFTYKYNLDTLKKIYGEKIQLCADITKAAENKWIRGWFVSMDHKKDKYKVVVNEGTQGRSLDIFDLWTGFPEELEKGIMIY